MQYLARFNWKNHMEQNPCLVVNSRTTSNVIPFILWNLKKLWPSSQQTDTEPYTTQAYSVHIGTHYFRKIGINIIVPPTGNFPSGFLIMGCTKKKYAYLIPLVGATYHTDLILLPFETVISVTWWNVLGSRHTHFFFCCLGFLRS